MLFRECLIFFLGLSIFKKKYTEISLKVVLARNLIIVTSVKTKFD